MLLSLALVFLCGMLLGSLLEKLGVPRLLGMLVTGILLGPFGLDLLDGSILGISGELRQIALIIILARAGLNLDVEDLKKVGRPAVLYLYAAIPCTSKLPFHSDNTLLLSDCPTVPEY